MEKKYITNEELHELYAFEVLQPTDKIKIEEAADVLADTFIGVQVGSSFIQEPMMKASNMTKKAFKEYMLDCLSEVTKDLLTVVAVEKSTGKVVGASVAEFYRLGQEKNTVLLKDEQSAMNVVNLATDKLIGEYMDDLSERGIEVKEKQYVHAFLTGVRLEFNKKFIGDETCQLIEQNAKDMGAEFMFSFASNFRSQKMGTELLGYKLATDRNGKPIIYDYAKDDFFNKISKDVATEGQLLYKKLTI